jgi:hypothetical protein
MQIILILVPKVKFRRKICRKIRWFLADFSFKGLKQKDLNIQRLICNKKNTGIKLSQPNFVHQILTTKLCPPSYFSFLVLPLYLGQLSQLSRFECFLLLGNPPNTYWEYFVAIFSFAKYDVSYEKSSILDQSNHTNKINTAFLSNTAFFFKQTLVQLFHKNLAMLCFTKAKSRSVYSCKRTSNLKKLDVS